MESGLSMTACEIFERLKMYSECVECLASAGRIE